MLILLPLEFWDEGRGQQKADMKNKPALRWLGNLLKDIFLKGLDVHWEISSRLQIQKVKGWSKLDKLLHVLTAPTWDRQRKSLFFICRDGRLKSLAPVPAQGKRQCPCCFLWGCSLFRFLELCRWFRFEKCLVENTNGFFSIKPCKTQVIPCLLLLLTKMLIHLILLEGFRTN